MTTIKVDTITNAAGSGAPNIPDGVTIGGVALASVNTLEYYAQGTEPATPKDGAIWWDTGNDKFFQYMNDVWIEVSYTTPPPPPTNLGGRGVFGGAGTSPSTTSNVIEYITIATTGNATDFGDLLVARTAVAAVSNGARGVFFRTADSGIGMDYITIATPGNAVSFGNALSPYPYYNAGCSDGVYGVFAGGNQFDGVKSQMQYITIATTGNAVLFGDLTQARMDLSAAADLTYGIWAGGRASSGTNVGINTMDRATLATPANAVDFGDLVQARISTAATSNLTRMVVAGGYGSASGTWTMTTLIDYVTIATPSNATSFGNLSVARSFVSGCSNGTRATFAGGEVSGNTIDYITVSTPGNATDFGDLTRNAAGPGACSGN